MCESSPSWEMPVAYGDYPVNACLIAWQVPPPYPLTVVTGCGKLYRARSRLYRNGILQVNMRLKALAEIYTMHSFAQRCWENAARCKKSEL